jgi:hypothetical protein
MIEGLSHESAHAYLFALSLGDSFVDNPDDELHPSPLRADPRPLDGTLHATYVSARMHYALSHVIESGVLSRSEENEAMIPAKYLVNGLSITPCAPRGADVIEYLHIELFGHDVIYAEGATAETFAAGGS